MTTPETDTTPLYRLETYSNMGSVILLHFECISGDAMPQTVTCDHRCARTIIDDDLPDDLYEIAHDHSCVTKKIRGRL